MRFLRVLLVCACATVAYGLVLSFITAWLAPEVHDELVRGQPELEKLQRQEPYTVALLVGLAYWWVGLGLALMWWLAAAAHEPMRTFVVLSAKTLAAVALAAALVGCGVYLKLGFAYEGVRAAHFAGFLATLVCGFVVALRMRAQAAADSTERDDP